MLADLEEDSEGDSNTIFGEVGANSWNQDDIELTVSCLNQIIKG
jgi:hypothetical protein